MRKLIGITGSGAIGIDPFHPGTWSGSSRNFFLECKSRNLLKRAFGVEVPYLSKCFYALRNYSTCRIKWKRQFYMDTGYRESLCKKIAGALGPDDFECDFMQLGSMYNVPEIVRGRTKCYSYNDGNFIMSLQSPYFPKDIKRSKIEKIIDYERQVNLDLDIVFTMSEYLRTSFIVDYGISPDKVKCIGAGINMDYIASDADTKDYSNQSILFVGVDFIRKGGLVLIKAFKIVKEKFPDAVLNIVGPSEPVITETTSGIIWHGFLRKDSECERVKLQNLYQKASLFVMPSIYEPFGISPLEALAHSIPCIVSNAWALPENVPHNICGRVVTVGNYEELADNIIDLFKNPDLLMKYGKAGRQHVINYFTWEKVVERLICHLSC